MLPFPIISNLRQKSNYRIQKFIAGSSHIAVLGTNGQLYTRGNNQYGQLGDTTYSLGADYQEVWGLGLMFPQNDSVYRPLVIPDFN
ncbi:hypothetical protein pEaSNUABM49_00583 [Erwinia phage pEa_SNUABM_49]|nr:hypothetical protein pEaSNUABM49_00583 [Erwinia phage pEa_SNUABM_49]